MSRLTSVMQQHRSLPLVCMIVLLLVGYPLLPDGPGGDAILAALLALIVAAGVSELAGSRAQVITGLLLGAKVVAVQIAFAFIFQDAAPFDAELAAAAASIPFCIFVAWRALCYAVQHAALTNDRLIAAAAAYLLIGLAWSGVHAALFLFDSGAYSFAGSNAPGWGSLVYFSFVTMTTLGYGDVTPRTEPAQAAATLEALFGVFFLGFLVARMLTVYPALDTEAESSPSPVQEALL